MNVLGIETSCDETAAAVVKDGSYLLSNVVASQIAIHAEYGGVIPEIAARSHIEVINPVIEQALIEAGLSWNQIDAIAVTYAPGLLGSLLVGNLAARTLAITKKKPLYPVHHVEAHVYSNFLTNTPLTKTGQNKSKQAPSRNIQDLIKKLPAQQPNFPILALIVSGGHTQLMLFKDHGDYEIIGETRDDAVGEAFDKVAKMLGLPYPGGPAISQAAIKGNPLKYVLPISQMANRYDFSFSGLKTAVLRKIQQETGVEITYPSFKLNSLLSEEQKNDFAASFQHTAVKTLVQKTAFAYKEYNPSTVVIAGGVAANNTLRAELARAIPINIEYAPIELCTDNAAMIASLGYYQAQKTKPTNPYSLEVVPSLHLEAASWAK